MRILHEIHKLLVCAVTAPVRLYQRFLSPLKPQPTCRFSPTCSRYCIEAIEEWGIVIGLALTVIGITTIYRYENSYAKVI